MRRRTASSLASCIVLLSLPLSVCAQDDGEPAAAVPFAISEETTYITEPRTADGLVNYAAALEERFSEGVTPETNAAVLFYKALGPRPENSPLGEEFFQKLGMPRPDQEGAYLSSYDHYLEQELGLSLQDAPFAQHIEELQQASERPWKRDKFPAVAGWLQSIEEPLNFIVEGTQRSHYFSPIVLAEEEENGSAVLISMRLSGVQAIRSAARALSARAMLRAGDGKIDEAWNDVLATYRLGHLIGKGPTLIEALVGIAMQSMSIHVAVALIDHTEPDAALARRWLNDVKQLPPASDMHEKVELAERFMFLDAVQRIASGKMTIDELAGDGESSSPFMKQLLRTAVDWDVVLKMGNEWYDRLAAVTAIEDSEERHAGLQEMEQDLKALAKRQLTFFGVLTELGLAGSPRRTAGESIGRVMVSLMIPAIHAAQRAEDRVVQQRTNLEIALALAAYRSDEGHYPARLEMLAPRYLEQIPPDIFGGAPLQYRPDERGFTKLHPESLERDTGYLLYSIGENRWDEGGHPAADDLRIGMSGPD